MTNFSFPSMGFWVKLCNQRSSRLLRDTLSSNVASKAISSRTVTSFRKTPNVKFSVYNNNNRCFESGLKIRCTNLGLNTTVPVRTFSALCKRCCESAEKVQCDKSQWHFVRRCLSEGSKQSGSEKRTTTVIYICAIGVFMVGASYAGVPLYRIFCQATGLGGQPVKGHDIIKVENMEPIKDRVISVRFNADVASSMQWNFKPQQTEVKVLPGETALAFYTAKNPTDKPIIGISTYNVVPSEAGQYFNKIQCFCFEEQRLNPHEQVDMPVFFFIDPEFAEDPKCAQIDTIMLSYTFFEAKEGLELPYPGYAGSLYAKSGS